MSRLMQKEDSKEGYHCRTPPNHLPWTEEKSRNNNKSKAIFVRIITGSVAHDYAIAHNRGQDRQPPTSQSPEVVSLRLGGRP